MYSLEVTPLEVSKALAHRHHALRKQLKMSQEEMAERSGVKKQLVNPKKSYSIDPVLSKANSLSFSKDLGVYLYENKFIHDESYSYYSRRTG